MCAEDRIMAKAQMNQSWYDTHMKMKRKHKDSGLNKHVPITTIDNENGIDSITRLMSMFDVPDLRDRLFDMQQEMCAYHAMLDEMEELKAANEQLECEAAELFKESSLDRKRLKKYAYNTMERLQNEIAGLKIELAQSREKEDSHVARMRSALNEMESLGEEVKALRERADIQQITNKRIEVPEKSSFLSSFNRGAMRGICERLDHERIHAQRSYSFTAVSA
jgi:uncharacterized coiled-coil DUF342 family protein